MRRLIIIICCCVPFVSSLAQTTGHYHIQQFTTDNGMPSNGIKGMEWDERTGFLWIATEAGMTRFNGVDFINFTKENTAGLTNERMAYMVKSDTGSIFVADGNGRFFITRNNLLLSQTFPQLKQGSGFKTKIFLAATNSNIRDKILSILNQGYESPFYRFMKISDDSIIIINPNRKIAYYISRQQPGYRERPVPNIFVDEFMIDGHAFARDGQRKLYLLNTDTLSYVPVPVIYSEGTPAHMNSSNYLLFWDVSMNNPILFSGNNAWQLHYRRGIVEAELICSAVPSNSFIRFAQYSERNRTLFIGTDSKGIIVINEDRVAPLKFFNTDIRERNAYYSQVELLNGYVLTNEAHVIGPGNKYHGPLPIKGKFDFSVYTTGDSLIWYSQFEKNYSSNVLHCYDFKTTKNVVYGKIPLQSNFAITYSGGKFYIANSKGLGYLDGDSIRFLFQSTSRNDAAPANAMLEFSPGVLGVVSCYGLILYDIRKNSTDTLEKAAGNCFRNLWRYKEYVFVGTYGKGYYMWKNGKLKPMPLDKNKFLLYAHCFVPDNDGYCWISSNRGLFKAQLSDLVDAFENNKQQVYYHYFGKNDGMDITEMNGGCAPCALVMKNNILSFPTMDGLLWVDPQTAKPLLPEGNIYLDEFTAGNKKINPDSVEDLSLSSSSRDMVIRLGFSSWCNRENIYLEYQLNRSSKWIPVDVNNGAYIRLNSLVPGKYNLLIRKMNGFGVNNYSYKEIHFTISAPWTRRWWFYVLSGLVLFGIVSVYLGWRTRQYQVRQRKLEMQVAEKTKELQDQNEVLEKNNSIKTRLISIISHDIVTPLKFVTVAGNRLLEKRNVMPEELQQETIKEMTNTSQELQLLSTNILNWIKYQNENRRMVKEFFDLHEMVNQVLGILRSLARQKGLDIINEVTPGMQVYQFYEPLKILVYNLLTNAIQFTETGSIKVAAIKDNGLVTVSVKDEGIGMTHEQIQRLMAEEVVITSANVDNKRGHGLGFLIIKDLVKTMEATLTINSKKEEGTTISVKMPAVKNGTS